MIVSCICWIMNRKLRRYLQRNSKTELKSYFTSYICLLLEKIVVFTVVNNFIYLLLRIFSLFLKKWVISLMFLNKSYKFKWIGSWILNCFYDSWLHRWSKRDFLEDWTSLSIESKLILDMISCSLLSLFVFCYFFS